MTLYTVFKSNYQNHYVYFQIFGPLQIRIIGPAFNGDITLSYHREGTDLLLVSLGETPFDTSDVNKEYLASVEYSLSKFNFYLNHSMSLFDFISDMYKMLQDSFLTLLVNYYMIIY